MKKLLNLDSGFSSIVTSWKDKTPIILTETVRMMKNLSKSSSFQIKNKKFSSYEDQDRGKRYCLYSKDLTKLLPRIQKLYQIPYILWNPLWSVFVQSSDSNLLTTRGGNSCVPVNLESPITYSKDTYPLLLTLELCYKPLGIFQRVIKDYF